MEHIIIMAASLATTYVIARQTGRGDYTLADLVIGLFAGLAGLGMGQLLIESADWRLGMPLFFACVLAFALEALPRRSSWR